MQSTLDQLKPGQRGVVLELLPSELVPRLSEMGVYSGQTVSVLYRAPLGDPIAVQVGAYVLSLRLNEAALVVVKHETTTATT